MRRPGSMEVLDVEEVRQESSDIWTIFVRVRNFEKWQDLVPGQFVMVWIPGVDEVPMSVSYLVDGAIGITVQNIGEATDALCSLSKGDRIGIRGPYGNGFSLDDGVERVIGVSGGVGGASTILPMEWAGKFGMETVNLVGSRNASLLLFKERLEKRARFSTDDGSFGYHGFVTDLLEEELEHLSPLDRDRTMIFTCGPEVMMASVARILSGYGVKGQFSLERYMKCGIGVCDSCSMSGKRVCMDGPVFYLDDVLEMSEFGNTHRDRSGRSVPLKESVK
ncbi:MAG: dihydroorotate dehydrogenase electron transfer subunit [Candidatus Thermoplasmatota archaeon]|nr:dihydroorotate dehydrogenase electron transfer subunit [Candidatus Thermoplasmatota archaeon]